MLPTTTFNVFFAPFYDIYSTHTLREEGEEEFFVSFVSTAAAAAAAAGGV